MPTSKISTSQAIGFLLKYLKTHRVSVAAGIVLLMVVDTFQLIIPRIIKKILDTIGEKGFSQTTVFHFALIIVGLAAATVVIRFFYRICIFLPSRKIETRMRDDLFSHLTGLSFSYFNVTKTGDLMALLINDLNAVRMATGMALIGLTDALFMGVLSLAFMLAIDVKLTLLSITPLPLIIVVMVRFGGLIQSKFKDVQESFGSLSSHTQEVFSGVRVIKGFAQERFELEHFTRQCDAYVEKNISLVRYWGVFFPLITLFASISIASLYFFGGRQVLSGRLSLGNFVSFAFYIQMFVWPIMATGWVFNIFQRGLASVKRLMELLEVKSDVLVFSQNAASLPKIRGDIRLKNLSFGFTEGGKKVLRNIDLTIPAGGSLGIVGKPGSGKTTLASLLFHLFPVKRDSLFVDGLDINDIPLDTLRSCIGYVPQDSFLFSDTIAQNIAFGLPEGPNHGQAIRRFARIAAIEKEIAAFPKGFETMVGERGITLSGGQKQRIAIARALMIKPPILIFDDALSAIDAGTEREIKTNMQRETSGKTTIIIAHRISTVMGCDTILVLDSGVIAEQGAHEQLIAQNGFYAKLFMLQKLRGTEQ